ncbi:type II toxin-antitoxin system PemK/MazF family toxin [Asaccharospora irregularis]|uniref:mRNA interferase MazF n=1 Tax=Asaccharospora irregularis DSM 2635 TaxID=1121321 RepID=A0A1M5TMI4_9FIRM|nr:type II toxin-antitoxin system PemK/MazF family toxin [Asaccharospora irregularis]SHH51898.1 mRNA interferase MazF [Asaccharospora irregularis DSM 2635]
MQIELSKTQKIINWATRKIYYENSKKHQRNWTVKRGEVYFVDLGENIGSEENKIRPCVVLQSNAYNFKSPVFTCAIISNSKLTIPDIQIPIQGRYKYINEKKQSSILTGTIDLGQIKTVGKERILLKVCTLKNEINDIDKKLFNVLGISDILTKQQNIINSLEGKVEYLTDKLKSVDKS